MSLDPFSVQVDSRPCRVAYLVDASSSSVLDEVIEFNRELWGGRFNPILLTDGESVDPESWAHMRRLDPDIIKSLVPLSETLRLKIQTFLSAVEVQVPRVREDRVHFQPSPLGILPNAVTAARVAGDYFGTRATLTVFDVTVSAPPIVRSFVERNFGRMKDGPATLWDRKIALKEAQAETVVVDSMESLAVALEKLSGYERVVFPSQLCSYPDTLPDAKHRSDSEHFTVVVGDEMRDVTHWWNRIVAVPQWLRTRFHQLWLPLELAQDSTLLESLQRFLRRYVESTGNQQGQGLELVSCSVDAATLESFAQRLRTAKRFFVHSAVASTIPVYERWTDEPVQLPRNQRRTESFTGYSATVDLPVREPDRTEAPTGSLWCADVYIQCRPERFRNFIGSKYFWQFPQSNDVLADTRFFSRRARVRRDRYPTVLMSRSGSFPHDERPLRMTVPSDESVAWALLCRPRLDQLDGASERERSFLQAYPSSAGQLLSGVLGLFPSLYEADYILRERYWRRVFAAMSSMKIGDDDRRTAEIHRWLLKQTHNWTDEDRKSAGLRLLARRALEQGKLHSMAAKELTFDKLVELAKEVTREYNAENLADVVEVDSEEATKGIERELQQRLSDLLAFDAVRVGIRPKCPSCGFRIWYHVDAAVQSINCSGCGAEFSLGAEERWHYQLNSLVRAGVGQQGTVPVLLVLGQMLRSARSSFIFAPPMDLFERGDAPGSYRQHSDADIVCIRDGRFVIGEVKASSDQLTAGDFEKVLATAKLVKPDEVIFAALEGKKSDFIQAHIDRLRSELKHLEVEVYWFTFDSDVLAPSPIRWQHR